MEKNLETFFTVKFYEPAENQNGRKYLKWAQNVDVKDFLSFMKQNELYATSYFAPPAYIKEKERFDFVGIPATIKKSIGTVLLEYCKKNNLSALGHVYLVLKPEGCKKGEGEVQMFACSIFVNSEDNFSFKKIDAEPEIEAEDTDEIIEQMKENIKDKLDDSLLEAKINETLINYIQAYEKDEEPEEILIECTMDCWD